MKQFIPYIIVLVMAFTQAVAAQNNGFPANLVKATQNGDATTLAAAFNDNVELVLPGKSGIYGKFQAEMVVREFFSMAEPQEFKVIHEGTRENASYVIGALSGRNENFRVYFLTKSADKKTIIHQLRIEKQDD